MGFFRKIKKFISLQDTLEDKIFCVVLLVGVVIVAVSTAVTFVEDLSPVANVSTAAAGFMLVAVFFVAYVLRHPDLARLMLCLILNCFVCPLAFFVCGGIDSGMPLYMVAGIFLIVPVLKGKRRMICIGLSIITDVICIILSYDFMPGAKPFFEHDTNILAPLSLEARFIDMLCSLVLITLYLVVTTALIMNAYQEERAKRERLLAELDYLSRRDGLTGLNNRREMNGFLEKLRISDERFYMLMIDIDHFKLLNDTHGHSFGDVVLKSLAEIMQETIDPGDDEMIARYGGEEFLIVMKADDMNAAYEKADTLRKNFEKEKWEVPELVTTFSGGLVHCSEYENYYKAITDADKMLYEAKDGGRNSIRMR